MQKKLLAAAVAAVMSPAVFAANVQLVGAVDEFIAVNHTSGKVATALKSGGVNASHWGIKATEKLGSGAEVFVNIDQAFTADTGEKAASGAGRAWSREANLGVRGKYGSISFGRQYTPHFLTFLFYDPTGLSIGSSYSPFFYVGPNSTCGDYGDLVRTDNSISYVLPTSFGLTNFFFVALGEHTNSNGVQSNSRGNLYNYAAKYDAGPFSTMGSYMYQSVAEGLPGSAKAGQRYKVQWLNFSVSYDFGFTKPVFQFEKKFGSAEHGSNSFWMTQIGTSTPVAGGKWMISASYLRNQDRSGANSWSFGTKYNYPLSKATKVYCGFQATVNGKNSGYAIEAGPDSSLHFDNQDSNTIGGTGYGTSYLGKDVQQFFAGMIYEF